MFIYFHRNFGTFIMVVFMPTEGGTDGKAVIDAHQHSWKASEVLSRLLSVSVYSRASIADAHDERTTNTACCWCG